MAHTYRRINARHEYDWVLRDWVFMSGSYSGVPVMVSAQSEEGRQRLAKFHRDRGNWQSPPAWFRRCYEHSIRATNKEEIHRAIRVEDYDPQCLTWHRHSALWDWA